MKIEYDSRVPRGAVRFKCRKCGSQYLCEKEGEDGFIKNTPRYLPETKLSYCPICGHQNEITNGKD